jgi:subtilisin family serine protease
MRLYILPLIFLAIGLQAQQKDNFSIELRAGLKTMEPTEELHLYIRGEVGEISTFVRSNGGVVKSQTDDVLSIRIPVEKVYDLRHADFVDFIEYSSIQPTLLADVMLTNNNIHPIHAGANPLPQAYLGDNVIMGIVDSGIELDHPDFQFEDGSTRVISLWDHLQDENDPFRVPEPYGYGQEWNAEDIDADIDGHEGTFFGHGSNVAGIAAGNANATGDFLGVAPNAELIVVQTDFSRENWTNSIADAIEFIFDKADALGKPAVVNLSLGTYSGSRDGLDGAALRINELLEEQEGRVVVSAAGNSHQWEPWHLSYDIPEEDTAFTWITYNTESFLGEPAAFIDLWADSADFYGSSFTIGADLAEPSYSFAGYAGWRNVEENLGVLVTDTIFNGSTVIGIVETWVGQRGDQYNVQIAVREAFSDQYKWRFATTGGGTFDVWSRSAFGASRLESENLPSEAEYAAMEAYQLPDNLKSMVGSWACSDHVITVANYVNRNEWLNYLGEIATDSDTPGELSENSSSGPTRDGRLKPDITASGDQTLAAGDLDVLNGYIDGGLFDRVSISGWHYINGGTSMASPVVAGVAALYLQRDPTATYEDIRNAIIDNALADQFTGALPDLRWGNGKLNGFAVLTEPFGVTSSEFIAVNGELKIFPNPTRGELTIVNDRAGIETFDLYDLSGRLVKSLNLAQRTNEVIQLSLTDLSDGIYIVQAIQQNGEVLQSKLMIEK